VNDGGEFFRAVVVEPVRDAEPRQQGAGQHAGLGGGSHEGERGEAEGDGAGVGPRIDDDVELEILHRRVEVLLDRRVKAVDLVDEEKVAVLEIREDSREITRLFNLGPTGHVNGASEPSAQDMGECRFPETGRSA